MSSSHPFAKSPPRKVDSDDDDNVSMKDNSPSSKNSEDKDGTKMTGAKTNVNDSTHTHETRAAKEEIDFEENPFQIPPSFNQSINEETLHDDDHPYVFWASLWLPIPKDPVNPMAAVFDALEEFVTQLANEDPNFIVFLHNVSEYKSVDDLPPPIKTPDDLPGDIDEWLIYFPQAKPWLSGGDTYTSILISLSIPLPKLVKNLSAWLRNKHYGIWKAYL